MSLERITTRELDCYAKLLGRGSRAALARAHVWALRSAGHKPKVYLTDSGFVVAAKGQPIARFF